MSCGCNNYSSVNLQNKKPVEIPYSAGWTPVISMESVTNGNVLKVTNWIGGGASEKPKVNVYVSGNGFVEDINDAIILQTVRAKDFGYEVFDWS